MTCDLHSPPWDSLLAAPQNARWPALGRKLSWLQRREERREVHFGSPAKWRPPARHASAALPLAGLRLGHTPVPGGGPAVLIFLRSPQRDGNCAALFPSEGISFYDESAGNSLPAVPLGIYKAERLLGSELRFWQRRNALRVNQRFWKWPERARSGSKPCAYLGC